MPYRKASYLSNLRRLLTDLVAVLLLLQAFPLVIHADPPRLSYRSLTLQNSEASIATSYAFSFTINSSDIVGSMDIQFCSNTPLEYDSCTTPVGMDDSNAQLSNQDGLTDFNVTSVASNEVILSRTPSLINAPLTQTFTLTNVVNPSSIGGYYARVSVFSSSNITGPAINYGGFAFAISSNVQISSYVPPYITFCVGISIPQYNCLSASGDYIDFGNLDPNTTAYAASQLLAATNASDGYIIQDNGTTMTSGNNIISAMTQDNTSRLGVSQFGVNLRANTTPPVGSDPEGPGTGQPTPAYDSPNTYQFLDNDTIASASNADDYRKYTVSYIVNVSSSQPPGVYVSTLTYVCTGSF